MEYFRAQDTYLVRLDPEEEILTQLHALAEKERIQLAEVSGLGALKEFEICVYNVAEKAFYHNALYRGAGARVVVGHDHPAGREPNICTFTPQRG